MKIKQLFKRAAATVMAAVTVLSLLPATAFAATGDVGTISFTHTYDSAGNVMYYNSSAVINGYTAGGAGKTSSVCMWMVPQLSAFSRVFR